MSLLAAAQTLNGSDIGKKIKAALEPNVPGARCLTVSVNQGSGQDLAKQPFWNDFSR
jgi:hypothetical protein